MREQTSRSPMLAAPGSKDFVGLIATSTAESIEVEEDEFQAPSPDDLCKRYIPLARKIAKSYGGRGIHFDELESAGYWGLLLASRKFDPTRGVPFGGYAKHWIKGEIKALFKTGKDALGCVDSLRFRHLDSLNEPVPEKDDEGQRPERIDLLRDRFWFPQPDRPPQDSTLYWEPRPSRPLIHHRANAFRLADLRGNEPLRNDRGPYGGIVIYQWGRV